MDIKTLLVDQSSSIKQALQNLDSSGQGTLFVVDQNEILLGIATDGDIRRALLRDVSLNSSIKDIMNTSFTALPAGSENVDILAQLNNRVKLIPLIDNEGKIVDYASISRLRKIMIASPLLEGNEMNYVSECIKTNWISSQGKFVRDFEQHFSQLHGNYNALAVSNGTVALHLALVSLGIGKGDEVLIPDLTFAASVNAVLYTGATPILIDIDQNTWNIDPSKIEEKISPATKAIMPVHLYGQACNMDAIMSIANKHKLLVIEDSAEALGTKYKGQSVGSFGDASTFSFFGNKTITTGEGGMVLFKDETIAKKAATLRDHGMNKQKRYWHDEIGFNYRLTNLQAAVGVAQFEQLDKFTDKKRSIASFYNVHLKNIPFFQLPTESENTKNTYWLYTLLIKENAPFSKNDLMEHLSKMSIETRPVFYPLHQMPPYQSFGNSEQLKVSTSVSKQGISLPSATNLTTLEQEHICKTILDYVQSF